MRNKKKAFTLIELVIVIIIVGILAAVAIPRFIGLRSESELSIVHEFGAALKSAFAVYLSALHVEGVSPSVSQNLDFNDFVAYTQNASDRNTIVVSNSLRAILTDPSANISNGSVITLNVKGGGIATYRITSNNGTYSIVDEYTDF